MTTLHRYRIDLDQPALPHALAPANPSLNAWSNNALRYCLTPLILLLLLCAPAAAAKDSGATEGRVSESDAKLLLQTNFEKEVVQHTSKSSHDLIRLTLSSGQSGDAAIQYGGGDTSDRLARVIDDPTDENNRVLHYWLKEPNTPGQRPGFKKGRIQLNLTNVDRRSIYLHYRMYLHEDLKHYQSFPKENGWFTISSLWMGLNWRGHPHPFKISLNIGKEAGTGSPLRFVSTGSINRGDKWHHVWGEVNREFEVPIGQWLDVELGYRQGDKDSGRYFLSIQREHDPAPIAIFDITDWTYHPDSPRPVSLTNINPLKLYTSSKILNHISRHGGAAQIYWDDLELWDNWPE